MADNMDAMMADGLLRTVRDAAKLLYGENQTYPCDDVKRMMDDVGRLRAALREIAAMDEVSIVEWKKGDGWLHQRVANAALGGGDE